MIKPQYEYRCGTCKSRELVIRPVAPGSSFHPNCFTVECGRGHRLVGASEVITFEPEPNVLEFRRNRRR